MYKKKAIKTGIWIATDAFGRQLELSVVEEMAGRVIVDGSMVV